ncbi:hypothetical protein [Erythrobacter sp. F6033]|uniref:hypothetical protein n=1 Tax=Erythrobacter sp. F6033 TaxID=2926401 RepID=UPI001FF4FA13|nr:hypothetical protein [Erythrobacter sp. F6033]MCK0128427.1 hypothetical protein [Erythrobacter sp. F6033]
MNKANIFMGAGWVGLAALVAVLAASAVSLPQWFSVASTLTCVGACWVMLFTRNADEYTRGLWTAAASMAFATLLILFLGLPFAEGVYDGFRSTRAGTPGEGNEQDIPALTSIAFAILAFYVGLFWKRLRGGM